jgi:hypothetical protein
MLADPFALDQALLLLAIDEETGAGDLCTRASHTDS